MKRSMRLAAALAAVLACSDADAPNPTTVVITAPASPLHMRGGDVRMQVYVDGAPERVHRFTARALIHGGWSESAPLEVVVDRTPPALAATSPAEGPPARAVRARGGRRGPPATSPPTSASP